jgi:hypothetical protein
MSRLTLSYITSLTHPRKVILVLQIGNRKSQRLLRTPTYFGSCVKGTVFLCYLLMFLQGLHVMHFIWRVHVCLCLFVSRLGLGNVCYLSFQNLFSCCCLCKMLKIIIYITDILPLTLYVSETWSFKLREHWLRVLRTVLGTILNRR